jgi:lipopolysaccharide/colanic/teichoic acid biosynthesis glycosyltransferase
MASFASPTPLIFLQGTDVPGHVGSECPHPSANSLVKRAIDIIGSVIGLLILACVIVPVAIAIKLDSPGAVLYTQQRCGLQGQKFKIVKFRTMVQGADSQHHQTNQPFRAKAGLDARVTRVGQVLRKTSLDELPQFWNVLMGEMSLVGTRPPTLDEVAHYSDHHWQRLNVKPGITGEWQVSGRSKIVNFEEIVNLDLRYQTIWSPLYDLVVLWKTVWVVISGSGAC